MGELDIGETARYGLHYLLQTNYAPRARLIRFFNGMEYPDEGNMIDRTFCALRVWAVIRPNEMRTWIRILDDEKMRKALTWLLQHPVGEGSKRVSRSDSVAQPGPARGQKERTPLRARRMPAHRTDGSDTTTNLSAQVARASTWLCISL